MKYFFPFFIFKTILFSAQTITVNETAVQFPSGTRNAVVTTIYWNDRKESVMAWQNFLEKYKYESIAQRGKEIYVHNALFKDILNRPVDIYSTFEENKEEKKIVMSSALDIGASNYLKSETNPAEFKIFENLIREFALQYTKKPLESFIKSAADYQVKLSGEIKKLEREINSLQSDILSEQKKIARSEEKVKESSGRLNNKNSEWRAQKSICDTMAKGGKELEAEKLKLEKLDREKTQLEKESGDLKNNILACEKTIADIERKKTSASENISAKQREIETQKTAEANWRSVLSGVR